jgi:hypothetical protein
MPILGIMASSVLKVTNSYESIATVTVGSGGTTNVTFSSIPSTYKHLQVRMNIRSNRAVAVEVFNMIFNSTQSNQYAFHYLAGNGSVTQVGSGTSSNDGIGAYIAGDSATSGVFGGAVTDILDYTDTNKQRTIRTLGGVDNNGSGGVMLGSALWNNSSAINSIKFVSGGTGWVEYSSFALYGIK